MWRQLPQSKPHTRKLQTVASSALRAKSLPRTFSVALLLKIFICTTHIKKIRTVYPFPYHVPCISWELYLTSVWMMLTWEVCDVVWQTKFRYGKDFCKKDNSIFPVPKLLPKSHLLNVRNHQHKFTILGSW